MKMNQISLILLLVAGLFTSTVQSVDNNIQFHWHLTQEEKGIYIWYKIGQFIVNKTIIENPKTTAGVIGCITLGIMINKYLERLKQKNGNEFGLKLHTPLITDKKISFKLTNSSFFY